MIYGRIRPPRMDRRTTFHSIPLKDRTFGVKLLSAMAFGLLFCTLLFVVPALYFVEQNYEIFTSLAYDVKPGLVLHLEREILWLRIFLIAGSGATIATGVYFFHRVVRHLLQPLEKIEDHLQALGDGDWQRPIPSSPDAHTYRTFFIAYENFHHSLKMIAESDVKLVQKIILDPNHRDSLVAWKTLLANQYQRLGKTQDPPPVPIENVEESSEVVPFRRVS